MRWNRKATEEEENLTAKPPVRVMVTKLKNGDTKVRAIRHKPEGMGESIYPEEVKTGWQAVRDALK